MDLKTILSKTVSLDRAELEAAGRHLQQALENNYPEFLKSLSEVLCDVSNHSITRTAAGLQLKNALTSKDPNLRIQYMEKWLHLNQDIRNYVKRNVLSSLGTESTRPSSAAQCVAYIAVIEIPKGLWPEVIQCLTHNVTSPTSTEIMREATLEAIGYICQDIEPEILVSQSNEILTAIVHGMRKDEPSNHVKLAATNALLNSLEFTRANFDQVSERHFIMQVVCESTQSEDTPVRVAALQCLVKIMSLYYQYMEHYMAPALFAITLQAMKSDVDEVALQGIEFWSNVCDEEVDLAIEASEAQEQGLPPSKTSRFYAKGALAYLVPTLIQCLTKQEEHDDEDDWNPCKAAGVCLMLMASCCEDAIISHVLPFVNDNIRHPDWRYRDASVMAFGSILEGPDTSMLKPNVEKALPMFLELMNDPSVVVRDTCAWTIGRICELIPEAVLNEALNPLLETLVNGLSAEPRVAANICWAFNSLAEAAYEAADKEDDCEPKTYVLSKCFEFIVSKLLETTERTDAHNANLRSAAYEALMALIKNSPQDCYVIVQKTTMVILQRLQQVLQLESHIQNTDRSHYNDLQSLLCATLQSVLRKMTKEDAPQISDAVMSALLQMFDSNSKTGGVQEDAIMAVGTLVEVLSDGFLKYIQSFEPILCSCLKNHADHQVCSAAVGLVGDICRAVGVKILPYCDNIMSLLLENLTDNNVNKCVKPLILGVFGDIALAIGVGFAKYLPIVLSTLSQASILQVNKTDYEMVEYVNDLRENCLEAYTGIVQGLKGDKEAPNQEVQLLAPQLTGMVQFIIMVASDHEITDSLVAACAGLIGDLCSAFGPQLSPFLDNDQINTILQKGKRSKASKTRTLSTWAQKEMRRLKAL